MAKMIISCKEATQFISQKEEGKLSFKKRLQLLVHLGICSFCKIFQRQNKILVSSAKEIDHHTNGSLSEAEKQSIIDVLQQD